MTIIDSRPPRSITIRLEFLKPFAATNTAQFDFAPGPSGTTVTWTMTGHNSFMGKAIGVVMNMDTMVGSQFEDGLATLDQLTAAHPAS